MSTKRIVTGLVIAATATAAAPASAGVRQSGVFRFTSTVPGSASGNVLDVRFRNPDDPALKPYAAARMVIHIPRGTVTDTTVPPQCHASDAEILALGAAACPANTRIGGGYALSDNGGGDPRYSRTTINHFNNRDEVVGIGQNDDIPVIRTIDRTKIEGNRTTSNFPLFPGAPPPEPYTPVKRLSFRFPKYVRRGRAYTRTPPRCPKAGYWLFRVEFTYRDGVTQSIASRSPCVRKRRPSQTRRATG
jgi:hypothetical protein